jgi:hypothetical protein
MQSFVRGSHITFRADCRDAAGVLFVPVSAVVHIRHSGNKSESLIMVDQVAVWDSSVASPVFPVHWHIRADGCAQDGSFTLTAGGASPA